MHLFKSDLDMIVKNQKCMRHLVLVPTLEESSFQLVESGPFQLHSDTAKPKRYKNIRRLDQKC